jgi:hypothetical protein
VAEDTPELLQLVKEFRERLAELKNYVVPMLERVRSGFAPTSEGLSYLETKFHIRNDMFD